MNDNEERAMYYERTKHHAVLIVLRSLLGLAPTIRWIERTSLSIASADGSD